MKNKHLYLSFILLVCSMIWFCISAGLNRGYFIVISLKDPVLVQLKQLIAMVFLWVSGFVFMSGFGRSMPGKWQVLFALPIGCALWSFSSVIILMAGIPYRFATGLAGCILLMAALSWFAVSFQKLCDGSGNDKFKTEGSKEPGLRSLEDPIKSLFVIMKEESALILLLLSIAFFCASGIIYTFVSYDSFYYFINYGHALASVGNYRALMGDNTITLTNIGQFVPMLCSFLSFFGIDQPYGLQAFLGGNLIVMFGTGLYDLAGKGHKDKRTGIIYTGIFTMLLFSSTSYLVISSWMLANMYCMVYIFAAFITMVLYEKGYTDGCSFLILNAVCFTSLTLIRKDGIIFSAFLFVCIICRNAHIKEGDTGSIKSREIPAFGKKSLALMFLPATLTELIWLVYVRVILEASVRQSSPQSIANNKNIVFILCIIGAAYVYLLFGHDLVLKAAGILKKVNEYHILLAGMVMAIILAFILKGDMVIDNIDFTIRNMVMYPSAWGLSAVIFAVLFVFSIIPGDGIDHWQFLWMGYGLLNLISYSMVDSKWLWVNWDDSYSRVLLQMVPVFVFIMAVKINELIKDKQYYQ